MTRIFGVGTEILKSDFLSQEPSIREFKFALREYLNIKHAVVCSNGTSALHLSCLASKFGYIGKTRGTV